MAKMSKAERAELEARLAADDEDDDDESDEVELGLGDGKYFRGPYRRARGVAAAHGYKLEPEAPKSPARKRGQGGGGSDGGGSAGGGDGGGDGAPDTGRVVFGRRQSRSA